jgi:hypothetical protein
MKVALSAAQAWNGTYTTNETVRGKATAKFEARNPKQIPMFQIGK